MEKTINECIEEIKAAERITQDKAMLKRLLAIRLLHEGYKIPQVMQIVDCSEKSVYNYQASYAQEGITGLTTKPKPGRDKKLTTEQENELYETIKTKLPNQVGFTPFANWTSSLAGQWIKKTFGVKYSERGVRALFKRLGLSYTRPTYTLKKADPEKQAAFKSGFEAIKKTD
jgi:putative transposase